MNGLIVILVLAVAGNPLSLEPSAGEGTCLLDGTLDVFDVPRPITPGSPTTPDADCFLPADAPIDGQLLIDLRPALQSADTWVENSIEEPVAARIVDAPPFSGRALLLFGDGRDDHRILQACQALRERKVMPVHVVEGGIRGLVERGALVRGDLHALRALQQLDAATLHQRLVTASARILDLSGAPSADRARLPHGVQWVEREAARRDGVDIVLLAPGSDLEPWRSQRMGSGPPPLVYEQGLPAYRAFLEELSNRSTERFRTAPLRCAG